LYSGSNSGHERDCSSSNTTCATIDPIEQVLAAGLMDNYPDGQFHSEQLISRAELALC